MITTGIDKIAIYTSRYQLKLAALAGARGIDPKKYETGLGQYAMSVPPPGEDVVTMAANAAQEALIGYSLDDFELLLFATESGIDQSKSAGIYVHELLGLPARCRTLELKQACYSATAALQLSLPYLRENPSKKVLLIAADIARYGFHTAGESSQGAGAVAIVLSAAPSLLIIEPEFGVITDSHMDFWRPNYRHEALVDGKYSSKLYLTMLEKTWHQYQTFSTRQFKDHTYFCYHAPVPRLVEKAHQHLRKINGLAESSDQDVAPTLLYSRQIGNSYTASLYICITSLLENAQEDLAGKRIGFYSYGSGCVAEYFSGKVTANYKRALLLGYHNQLLNSRQQLSYDEYQRFYAFPYIENGGEQDIPIYATGAFRLCRIEKHKRLYEKVQGMEKITPLFFSNNKQEQPNNKQEQPINNLQLNPIKKVLAPAKLILSGEHAVVHGLPALAMAINRYVTATVTSDTQPQVLFDFADLPHRSHLSFQGLKHLKNRLKSKYHKFINGDFSIRDVLQKPFELAQFALSLIADSLDIVLPHGVKIHLQSDIPIGCGMGSSAATIVSVMQAIAMHLKISISEEQLFKMALEAENLQHGQSSGLDLRVALNGGCLYMREGEIKARPLPHRTRMPFYLVNTGQPVSTTGQCVEKTKNHFQSLRLKQAFVSVTESMDTAIQLQSWKAMQEAVRANHRLLVQIGVVPETVQRFIQGINKMGGAGKICGSGAVIGERAGAVLVTGEDKAAISSLCLQYGYNVIPIAGVERGVHAA